MNSFATRIVRWQAQHGRHDLPWQATRDPYRIWISEIMLQQTQVSAVVPFYGRFLDRFPDVQALSHASEGEVLALWSGLGYYARARNLLAAADLVAGKGGAFPSDFESLSKLPGIGRSTAAAIAVFAGGERHAILDGNVRRVLARHAGLAGHAGDSRWLARLWEIAEARLPRRGLEGYTQGLMDLGSTVCTSRRPACERCPVKRDCAARARGIVAAIPGAKPRPAPRRRRAGMLLVVSRGEVLLEKRPSAGIWGGLWSLPETPASASPQATLERDWGIQAAGIERLEPFEHAFTHFTLEVLPWRVRIRRSASLRHPEAIWLPLSQIEGAALPSPVRRLLERERNEVSRSASAGEGTGAGSRGAASRR